DLPRYKQQAGRLGLDISFPPPMPAREAFALGRIVVVPSRAEAMPYLVLEALAAGKTMVATAVGGIPEVFAEGSPALVAPNRDSIAAALSQALEGESQFASFMPSRSDLMERFGASAM